MGARADGVGLSAAEFALWRFPPFGPVRVRVSFCLLFFFCITFACAGFAELCRLGCCSPHIGVAIGEQVLDLHVLSSKGMMPPHLSRALAQVRSWSLGLAVSSVPAGRSCRTASDRNSGFL
jgi:hypothetical protein